MKNCNRFPEKRLPIQGFTVFLEDVFSQKYRFQKTRRKTGDNPYEKQKSRKTLTTGQALNDRLSALRETDTAHVLYLTKYDFVLEKLTFGKSKGKNDPIFFKSEKTARRNAKPRHSVLLPGVLWKNEGRRLRFTGSSAEKREEIIFLLCLYHTSFLPLVGERKTTKLKTICQVNPFSRIFSCSSFSLCAIFRKNRVFRPNFQSLL